MNEKRGLADSLPIIIVLILAISAIVILDSGEVPEAPAVEEKKVADLGSVESEPGSYVQREARDVKITGLATGEEGSGNYGTSALPNCTISCGSTISSSCQMNASLSNCDGHGITISQDNVELDCQGFNIDGDGDSNGWGITISGRDNINITNCNVTDFDNGIAGYTITNSRIENNFVSGSYSYGIYAVPGHYNTFRSNEVMNSGNSGFYLYENQNSTFVNNTIRDSRYNGINAADGSGIYNNTFYMNILDHNLNSGFYFGNCNYNNLTSNEAYNHRENGFYFAWGNGNNTLVNNTAKYNNRTGFYFSSDSRDNTVIGTVSCYNNMSSTGNYYDIDDNDANNFSNTTCSTSSGMTCNYTCPFEASCGSTVTSDYTLTGDLTGCTGDGIIIGANDTTLDCDGYTIASDGSAISGEDGITAVNRNNITIKNCTISEFYYGIYARNVDYSTFTSNTLAYNYDGVYAYYADYNDFTGNTIDSSGNMGIYLYSFDHNEFTNNTIENSTHRGIYFTWSINNTFTNNTANNNNEEGLYLYYADYNDFIDNRFQYNYYSGAYMGGYSNDNTFTDTYSCFNNEASGSYFDIDDNDANNFTNSTCDTSDGMTCNNTCPFAETCGATLNENYTLTSDITGCAGDGIIIGADDITLDCNGHTISSDGSAASGENGIEIISRSNVIVKNCIISGFDLGIWFQASRGAEITNNTLTHNTLAGIGSDRLNSSIITQNTLSNNSANGIGLDNYNYNNTISFNRAVNNSGNGISLRDVGTNNTIANNTAGNNGGSGININSVDWNRIINNTASNNTGNGIYVISADSNTFAGNKAQDNNLTGIYLDSTANSNTFTDPYACGNRQAGPSYYDIHDDDANSFSNATCTSSQGMTCDSYCPGDSNSAPSISQAFVNSSSGGNLTTDDLTCWANATDYNGHDVSYSGYWYKNGAQDAGFNTAPTNYTQAALVNVSTLDSSQTTIGDNWSCYVRAYDGENYSNYNMTANLTIVPYVPSCGDTITADLTMTADFTGCTGKGIIIGANDITLDCAGHTIDGVDTASTTHLGIEALGRNNITIKNCDVTDFYYGIYTSSTNYSTIYNNTLTSNRIGAYLYPANSNELTLNTAEYNTNHGLYLQSNNNTIISNIVNNNSWYGINLQASSSDNDFINNTVYGNGQYGMYIYQTSSNTFEGNNITSNGNSGVVLTACFLAGTRISIDGSSYKNIEDVEIGDMVLAYNEHTGELEENRVARTFYHEKVERYLIINGILRLTENHPMYVNREWKEAGEIKIGDLLMDKDGNFVPVTSIEAVNDIVPVYNLEVDGNHNYFAENILTHNKCPRIFTYNGTGYEFDLLINIGQFGEENDRLFSYPTKNMKESRILMTYEPGEINYVDFIKVEVTDTAVEPGLEDITHLLEPVSCISDFGCELSEIAEMDKVYLILDEEKDEYYIEFEPIPELLPGYEREIRMVSSGYQIRIRQMSFTDYPDFVREFLEEYGNNSYNNFTNNDIMYNGLVGASTSDCGISVESGEQYNRFVNNTLKGNFYGMCISFADLNTFENNNITESTRDGIRLASDANSNNLTDNYVCYNNQASGSYFDIDDNDANSFTNNTCTLSDGMTCNYTCPFEASCGSTVTSDYTLTGDLTGCTGDGIIIGANDTTLDCDGYTIASDGSAISGEDGITAVNRNNITIKNCNISDFYYGIYANNADYSAFTTNTLAYNYDGVYAYYADYNDFTGNTIENSDSNGIYTYDSDHNEFTSNTILNSTHRGIYFTWSINNTFTNNTANNNNEEGIYLYYADYNDFIDNRFQYSYYSGVYMGGYSNDNTFTDTYSCYNNEASGSYFDIDDNDANNFTNSTCDTSDGMTCDNSCPFVLTCGATLSEDYTMASDITGCTGDGVIMGADNITLDCDGYKITSDGSASSGEDGITASSRNNITVKNCNISDFSTGVYLSNVDNSEFRGNTANDNAQYGFYVTNSDYTDFISNEFSHNTYDGVYISSSNNNTFTGNTLNNNDESGFDLDNSDYNTFTSNTANNNAYQGFYTYGSDYNTFTSNTFSDNGYAGFYGAYSTNNDFNSNTGDYNDRDGIYMTSDATGNTFTSTRACYNNQANLTNGMTPYDINDQDANNFSSNTCETSHNTTCDSSCAAAAAPSGGRRTRCTDVCERGEVVCRDGSMYVCGDRNDDGCTEWDVEYCGQGYECENGKCVKLACIEDWVCSEWTACENRMKERLCEDWNKCGTEEYKPATEQTCVPGDGIPPEEEEELGVEEEAAPGAKALGVPGIKGPIKEAPAGIAPSFGNFMVALVVMLMFTTAYLMFRHKVKLVKRQKRRLKREMMKTHRAVKKKR